MTNYAPFLTIARKVFHLCPAKCEELGYSWPQMEDWIESELVPFMKNQHQERGRPDICVRKYILALLSLMDGWSLVDRRKFIRVIRVVRAEGKVTTGDKYVLAFHPSRHVAAFQLLGGISLKDFKKDVALIGGCADHSASLLKDDVNPDMDIRFAILKSYFLSHCFPQRCGKPSECHIKEICSRPPLCAYFCCGIASNRSYGAERLKYRVRTGPGVAVRHRRSRGGGGGGCGSSGNCKKLNCGGTSGHGEPSLAATRVVQHPAIPESAAEVGYQFRLCSLTRRHV